MADGEDHGVRLDDVLRLRELVHVQAAIRGEAAEVHLPAAHSGHPAITGHDFLESAPGEDAHPFLLGLCDLPGMGGHVVAALQAAHVHLFGPQAHRRACHVNGHVAAAQHQHPLAQPRPLTHSHLTEEIGVEQHAGQVGPRNAQLAALVRAHRQEHGGVAVLQQRVHVVHAGVEFELHSQGQDVVNLALDQLGGQAVLGHSDAHHSPGDG